MDHHPTWQAFHPDAGATFVDRPNRFVVRALVGETLVEAHCPNPGRMSELLFPGVPVILEQAAPTRKLAYTLAAVLRPGSEGSTVTIPLISVRANAAVEALVLPRLFPGARSVRPEFTRGESRFDFLVEDAQGTLHLVEVKACSEVEFGSALFPDAPSQRARKHLEELAREGTRGYVPHVVFVVVHGRPGFLAPNLHTDPAFSRTLLALAPRLNLHAVVLETDAGGATRLIEADLPVWLPDPGPDAGHLIRVSPAIVEPGWTVAVEWYPDRFEKAVSRAPARSSFPLRGTRDRREEIRAALASLSRTEDPRQDPHFLQFILRERHGARP